MNRRIAAIAIAAVAVLGLTACSGAPASDSSSDKSGSASKEAPKTADQSVSDACGIILPALQKAGSDVQSASADAATDPKGTVDKFATAIGEVEDAAAKVTNPDVKKPTDAIVTVYGQLRDVATKALVDKDTSALGDFNTVMSDLTDSAKELATVCAG
ncbi:MAG: hypothetical protein LBU78_10400 [Microbacterium sp.]|jgi:hypothetical protein|nr:hypothetical protein [Microbacterium sp.]